MSDNVLKIIQTASADVRARLEHCPPALGVLSPKPNPQKFPRFFDGMPHYDADIFPFTLQQYITVFSSLPAAEFVTEVEAVAARRLWVEYEGRRPPTFYHKRPLSQEEIAEFISCCAEEDVRRPRHTFVQARFRDVWERYNDLLNRLKLNTIKVPETFSSLQLYTFFNGAPCVENDIKASARNFLVRIVESADHLDASEKTEDGLTRHVCQATGWTADNPYVPLLIDTLALRPRVGIFANERERRLAGVFFEALERYGFVNQNDFGLGLYQLCNKHQIPGIRTHGVATCELRKVLGSYYKDVMLPRIRNPDGQHLIKAKPVDPEKIKRADTIAAEVRQLISEETFNTGERTTSSLLHNAPYRDASRPQAVAKPKAGKYRP